MNEPLLTETAVHAALRRGWPIPELQTLLPRLPVRRLHRPLSYRRRYGAGQTIFFPDVSHYDADRGVHLESGTVAVIVKSTHGRSFLDRTYGAFRQQAAGVASYFTAYHWLNHGAAAAQAQYNWQQIGRVPVMVDAEDTAANTGYAGPLTVADIAGFVTELRRLGGVCNLVYLPHWYWQANMGSPDLTPLVRLGVGLVSSNYTTYSDGGPGWAPYGGFGAVAQWQYADNLPYGGSFTDFNAYKGTLEQYKAATGGSGTGDADMDANQARQLDDIWNRMINHGWGGQSTFGRVNADGTPANNFSQAIEGAIQAILTGDGQGAPINARKVPASLASLAADVKAVRDLVAQLGTPQLTFTDAQIAQLTPALVAAVTSAHDALTDADAPVIEAAVKQVLTGTTLHIDAG